MGTFSTNNSTSFLVFFSLVNNPKSLLQFKELFQFHPVTVGVFIIAFVLPGGVLIIALVLLLSSQ